MANSLEEFSNDFKETIKVIFNETEGSEWYKEFEEKFDKITKEDDKIIGDYGCSIGTMELMLFIRKRMRDEGLAPIISLISDISIKGKKHYNYIIDCMRNCSPQFIDKFPETYNIDIKKRKCSKKGKEIANYNLSYDVDGWNYTNIQYNCEDWMKYMSVQQQHQKPAKKYVTHFYYNELDHYLTYYVGLIKQQEIVIRGKDPGLKEIIREIALLKNIIKN